MLVIGRSTGLGVVHGSGFELSPETGLRMPELSVESAANVQRGMELLRNGDHFKHLLLVGGYQSDPVDGDPNTVIDEASLMKQYILERHPQAAGRVSTERSASVSTIGNWVEVKRHAMAADVDYATIHAVTTPDHKSRASMIADRVIGTDSTRVTYHTSDVGRSPVRMAEEILLRKATKNFFDLNRNTPWTDLPEVYEEYKVQSGLAALKDVVSSVKR